MLDVGKDHTNFSMKLGMEFESDDDAIEYYNSYAEATGFKIRKEYVNKNKVHGYVTSRKITCCKEGLQATYNRGPWTKRPRRETRTGCLAHIIVTRQENGKYRVTQFEEAHNHPLSPPNQKRVSRSLWFIQLNNICWSNLSKYYPKKRFRIAYVLVCC